MKRRTMMLSAGLVLGACASIVLVILGCAASQPVVVKKGAEAYYDRAATPAPAPAQPPMVPPQSLPAAGEEIWVIAKPEKGQLTPRAQRAAPGAAATRQATGDVASAPELHPHPGSGTLVARLPDRPEPVPVPLKHTDVQTHIAGYIATVDVTQLYYNPFDGKIEAVYVFPLPGNAAVSEFLMTIGDRKIRGIIRERAEAERIYREAKHQGYVTSLLTQERPNIFTQSVANIEPGTSIDINIKYFHTLEYVDGWYEYVFPMIVGPRFNPPGYTDGIGAKAHGAKARGSAVGLTGQQTEVSFLRPHERSGHDVALIVNIEAGVEIERIECRSHRIDVSNPEEGIAQVKLHPDDSIPNEDFVLRYKVAGERVKTALMTHRDARGGYFTLMIFPPESLKDLPRQPLEMVFTLDVSGSMSGPPIEQSRAAIRYALAHMRPDDTFQIIRFAGAAQRMSERPLPATPENVGRALQYMETMQAGGGTMMLEGVKESLHFEGDPSRLRFVAMLTDGYIGNENEILRQVKTSRGNARVFGFGVGAAPNRYLLDGMARLGAGVVAYIGLNDSAERVMADFFNRIAHPALVDVSVDWGAMQVSDVYPQRVPDLFVGRPVILTGRFTGEAPTTITVRGKVGGEVRELEIPINPNEASARHNAIASVWARMKISDLADQSTWHADGNYPLMIKDVALEHGLMSAYTAFVAVDSSNRTAGEHGTTVAVPVPVPQGVRYETTVGE